MNTTESPLGIDLAEPAAVPGRSQALTYNVLDRPETLFLIEFDLY